MKRISALLLILFFALPLKAQKEEITKGSKIIRLRYRGTALEVRPLGPEPGRSVRPGIPP